MDCEFETSTPMDPCRPVPFWAWYLVGSEIELQSPIGGESLDGGGMYTVGWENTPDVESVKLEFSQDGGTNWSLIDYTIDNPHEFEWAVPMVSEENCLIRASDAADFNTVCQSGLFSIKSCSESLVADFSGDCVVDFNDFGSFANQWLDCGDPCNVDCIE